MADILRLAGSDVPYTPLLNLTNGMVFITGNNDGVDVSGGSNVTISVSGQGDSAYMRSTNGVTVHDHGDAFHMGIDGAQDLTLLGVQNDPGFFTSHPGLPVARRCRGADVDGRLSWRNPCDICQRRRRDRFRRRPAHRVYRRPVKLSEHSSRLQFFQHLGVRAAAGAARPDFGFFALTIRIGIAGDCFSFRARFGRWL